MNAPTTKPIDSCDMIADATDKQLKKLEAMMSSKPVHTNVFGTNVERDKGYNLHIDISARRDGYGGSSFRPSFNIYLKEFNDKELNEVKTKVSKILDNLFDAVYQQIELDKEVKSSFPE